MRRKFKHRKFSDRMKEQWYRNNVIAICIAFISVSCLSIGYAALMQNLEIQGSAFVRANKDIRINNIVNTFSSCGTDVYNPKYTEDTITVVGDLPQLECVLKYDITLKNNTEFVMEVIDIEDFTYNNPAILYEFDNLEIGTLIPKNSEQIFSLTFKYDSALSSLPLETEIGAIFKFVFDYADIVVYENNYVTNGLLLLYDGRNNSGQGYRDNVDTWTDLVGSNDGTLMGGATWHNGYLEFDGIDDKVKFKGDLPPIYTITVTFEADFTNMTSWTRLFSENPFPTLYVNYVSGVRTLRMYGHGLDLIFPDFTLTEDKFQATMMYDGSSLWLYINGQYVSTLKTTANAQSVLTAYLGGRGLDNLRQFKGKMYNFMMYDRMLSPAEIKKNSDVDFATQAIPINTTAQLLKIGSGDTEYIDGKNYVFTTDANYQVNENLSISQNGLWNPNISGNGSITTYGNVITVTNTQDGSTHYYQNELYVTEDNAIKDGLVLHYDSMNNTGSGYSSSTLTWKDLKGTNDATLMNGVAWNDNRLTFDGVDDKVRFAGSITNNYTMIVTVKPVLSGTHPRFFAENPYPTVFMHHNTSYRIGFFAQGMDAVYTPSLTPPTFAPTYVVITYDSQKLKLYVNGRKISEMTITTNPTATQYAYLGGRAANDRQYVGDIYDFIVYDRVLSDFEIEKSYIGNSYKYAD